MSTNVLVQGNMPPKFFDQLQKCSVKDVFVLEGRPSLKAAKGSSWQLQKRGVTPTIMADNMAGYLFYKNLISEVWVGCQSVGPQEAQCDIGALILAVLAQTHQIPLYGYKTKVEKKGSAASNDLTKFNGQRIVAGKVKAFVPLAEKVPMKYFKGIYE